MKIASKLFGVLLLLVAMSATASALVDVTYSLNTQNANVQAYNCADSSCSTVTPFTGTFPNGASTSIGQLTVRFPSTLATQYGYAVFFSSDGYVPFAQKSFSHSYGDSKVFTTSVNVDLQKSAGTTDAVCTSTINSLSYAQDSTGLITATANLNAATTSTAFYQPTSSIRYVPSNLQNTGFSANTDLAFTVTSSKGPRVDYAENRTISVPASGAQTSFSFRITPYDIYTLKLTSHINDAQNCAQTRDSILQKTAVFAHVPLEYPSGATESYFTKITNLAITPQPAKNTPVTVSFELNELQQTAPGVFVPSTTYQASASYWVKDSKGNDVLARQTTTLPQYSANPKLITFSFTPHAEGDYVVTIMTALAFGRPSYQAGGLDNQVFTVTVGQTRKFNASFQPFDAVSGNKIVNATVALNGVSIATNSAGAMFENLAPGVYNYAITHNDYNKVTGSITVNDHNQIILVPMNPASTLPSSTHSATLTVVDSDGNAVLGAEAMVSSTKALTNSFGQARFSGLSNGTYTFSVSADGFATKTGTFVVAGSDVNVIVSLASIGSDSSSASSSQELFVSRARIPNAFEAKAGQTLDIYLSVESKNMPDMNAVATAVIPELGVRASAGPFNLDSGDDANKVLHLEMPADAEPGTYYVRIAVGEGKNTRVLYREVELS